MDERNFYYDGKSAHATVVLVNFGNTELSIVNESGAVIARWRYRDLFLLSAGLTGTVRVGARGAGNARLVLADPATMRALKERVPQLFKSRSGGAQLRRAALFAGFSLAALGTLYIALPIAAENLVPFFPLSLEQRLGERVREGMQQSWGFCTTDRDKEALAIVQGLVERLSASSALAVPVTVEFTKLKIENAFAIPGGTIIVTHSLLELMESPDEFAGVLAHELGHVVERHAVIGLVQSVGLSVVGTFLFGGGSGSGEWVIGAASTLASLSYSRRLERRADERGLAMLESANISTLGVATLFERLEKTSKKTGTAQEQAGQSDEAEKTVFLSSHPPSAARIAQAQQANKIDRPPALTATEWAKVKSICAESGSVETDDTFEQPGARAGQTQ